MGLRHMVLNFFKEIAKISLELLGLLLEQHTCIQCEPRRDISSWSTDIPALYMQGYGRQDEPTDAMDHSKKAQKPSAGVAEQLTASLLFAGVVVIVIVIIRVVLFIVIILCIGLQNIAELHVDYA